MVLDIIFLILVVVFAIVGFVSGLFKTFVSFFSWFLSLVLSYFLARAIADAFLTEKIASWIIDKSGIFDRIYGFMPEGLKNISMESIREAFASGLSEEQITSSIAEQASGLLFLVSSLIKSAVVKPMYLDSSIANVGLIISLEITYYVYVVLVGVLLFLILRIVIMGMTLIFKTKKSKVTFVSRLCGMGVGALKGFAYGCIVLVMAGFLSGVLPPVQSQIEGSTLSSPVTSWIENASEGIKDGKELDENASYGNLISALEQRLDREAQEAQQ